MRTSAPSRSQRSWFHQGLRDPPPVKLTGPLTSAPALASRSKHSRSTWATPVHTAANTRAGSSTSVRAGGQRAVAEEPPRIGFDEREPLTVIGERIAHRDVADADARAR